MFNIAAQFYAKLTLPLSLSVLEPLCYIFQLFAIALLLCHSASLGYAFLCVSVVKIFLPLRWLLPAFPLCNGENGEAAALSRVVAAFAPIWWLFSCFSPFFVAKNLPLSGSSRICRHSLRRQFRHLRQL